MVKRHIVPPELTPEEEQQRQENLKKIEEYDALIKSSNYFESPKSKSKRPKIKTLLKFKTLKDKQPDKQLTALQKLVNAAKAAIDNTKYN
tara:strand:+ start:182 stop:451 length:270 start_codon:yes stop_codon:yes gene_type:complete